MTCQGIEFLLVPTLAQKGLTIATCESLTAGLLSATIANVPGASAVLQGGLITYATRLKHVLADVDQATLDSVGPVSEQCAKEMALGALVACGSDIGVSLTGVAGPDPQDGHPVGEVWCGVAFAGHSSEQAVAVRLGAPEFLSGERAKIRQDSVGLAIDFVLSLL